MDESTERMIEKLGEMWAKMSSPPQTRLERITLQLLRVRPMVAATEAHADYARGLVNLANEIDKALERTTRERMI